MTEEPDDDRQNGDDADEAVNWGQAWDATPANREAADRIVGDLLKALTPTTALAQVIGSRWTSPMASVLSNYRSAAFAAMVPQPQMAAMTQLVNTRVWESFSQSLVHTGVAAALLQSYRAAGGNALGLAAGVGLPRDVWPTGLAAGRLDAVESAVAAMRPEERLAAAASIRDIGREFDRRVSVGAAHLAQEQQRLIEELDQELDEQLAEEDPEPSSTEGADGGTSAPTPPTSSKDARPSRREVFMWVVAIAITLPGDMEANAQALMRWASVLLSMLDRG